MGFNWNELTSSLETEFKKSIDKLEITEVGKVLTVGDGIVIVDGLSKGMLGEKVVFDTGSEGVIFVLDEYTAGIILLKNDCEIKQGTEVKRTKQLLSIPVGNKILGRVINALGEPLDEFGPIEADAYYPVERLPYDIMKRAKVSNSLLTGTKVIDCLIPIGKGQRELIVGDRRTGKTSIAIDTILNQKNKKVKCVYVAIGQKNSSIKKLYTKLKEERALEYTTIINANADQLATLQYLSPYSGSSIAEYWLDNSEDVLIIYDDLTKHAAAYRTLSLLLRRPPGREAYPGDVFYLHSRLLERACNLSKEYGGGSITALPIVETQEGDISSYIPTNIISITDGQIFLQSDLFNAQQRPAISISLSVSRVGSDAQSEIIKKLSASLKLSISQYLEMKSFSKLRTVVDENTRNILDNGEKIQLLLRQKNGVVFSIAEQALILYLIHENIIKDVPVSLIQEFEKQLLKTANTNNSDLIEKINNNPVYTEENICVIKKIINDFMRDCNILKEENNVSTTNLDNKE